jgi:hypothetical protein
MALPLALFARPARTGDPAREVRLVRWQFPTAASELALAVRPALVYDRSSVRPASVRAAKLDQGGSHVFSHICRRFA